jgi:hydrogenase expression/formation protein HypC
MMCLAVPAKLVALKETQGVADLHGNRVDISTLLVPEAKVGDWLLVHAGFAIQRLDPQTAQETFAVLKDVEAAANAGGDP